VLISELDHSGPAAWRASTTALPGDGDMQLRVLSPIQALMCAAMCVAWTAGCSGQPAPDQVGSLGARNESAQSVTIEIDVGTARDHVYTLPTWQEGWCSAVSLPVYTRPQSTIRISGSSLPAPMEKTIATGETGFVLPSLIVNSDGSLTWDATLPPQSPDCPNYPYGT
jgi:hypothetical protein